METKYCLVLQKIRDLNGYRLIKHEVPTNTYTQTGTYLNPSELLDIDNLYFFRTMDTELLSKGSHTELRQLKQDTVATANSIKELIENNPEYFI